MTMSMDFAEPDKKPEQKLDRYDLVHTDGIEPGELYGDLLIDIRDRVTEIVGREPSFIRNCIAAENLISSVIIAAKMIRDMTFVSDISQVKTSYPRFYDHYEFVTTADNQKRYVYFEIFAECLITAIPRPSLPVSYNFNLSKCRMSRKQLGSDEEVYFLIFEKFRNITMEIFRLYFYHDSLAKVESNITDLFFKFNGTESLRRIIDEKIQQYLDTVNTAKAKAAAIADKYNKNYKVKPVKKSNFVDSFVRGLPSIDKEKMDVNDIAALFRFSPDFLVEFSKFIKRNKKIRAMGDSIPRDWVESSLNAIKVADVLKKLARR